jgi:oxaloacetate decarboxylase alpha subunit
VNRGLEMSKVEFVDVTLRDGNQSLWGAMGMRTRDVLPIASALDRTGYKVVEFTNSMMMGVAVKTHREDPWERIRLMSQAMPNTPLGLITTPFRFMTWDVTPPAIMELGLTLLVRNGIRCFWITDPVNDMDRIIGTARTIKAAGDARVVVGITYSISPIHTDDRFVDCAIKFRDCPVVDALYFKDPGGLARPERVRALVPGVQRTLDGCRIKMEEIHTHNNTGLAPHSHLEALKHGITVLHTAVSPLANGTSHPSTESMIRNVRQEGYEAALDEGLIGEAARHFHRVAIRENFPIGAPLEYDAAYYVHQLPGGMYSTMKRQLAEVGMSHRFAEVLEEVPKVRKDLGYPIMVTPLSQIVGTQALLNVTCGERYSMVPDEVVYFLMGRYGKPEGRVDADVQDKIMSSRRAKELCRNPVPPSGAETIAELRKSLGPFVSDEELLLRAVMAADDVERMKRSLRASQNGASVDQSLANTLRAFSRRPGIRSVSVRWGNTSIGVSRQSRETLPIQS